MITDLEPSRESTEILDWARTRVDPALRAAVGTLPRSIRRIAGYHFGWWDSDERPTGHHCGKAIRPALTLLTAQACGGRDAAAAAIPAAVAIELAHNFSLLHDDVMDRDTIRRHRPTAWAVYGVNAAILVGDSLLTLAFDVLATAGGVRSTDLTRRLGIAIQALVEGQAQDIFFERRMDVTPAECLSMLKLKTAPLFAGAGACGVLAAGGAPAEVERYRRFGELLGLSFQLADDLLGIWGDPTVTGKPAYADLAVRKKSAPVVTALNSGTPAGSRLAELYRRPHLEPAALADAARLVDEAGGRRWSQRQADLFLSEALAELRSGAADTDLAALARLAARRTH